MGGNYVEIVLKARDEAKPDVDALKLALDELKGKVATALVDVDDGESEAKLLALAARLDAIGRKVENPRITVQGAGKAVADMAAVDVALGKVSSVGKDTGVSLGDLRDTTIASDEAFTDGRAAIDDYHAKLSALSNLLRDTEPAAEDAAQALGAVAPEAESAFAGLTGSLPGLTGMNFQMVGLGTAAAAAMPLVIGAGTSVAALGAAGALAYPQLKQVYDILTGATPGSGQGVIGQAVSEVRNLETAFKQASSQSGIGDNLLSKALPAGIEAIENVLGDLGPVAKAGATSIDDIAGAVDRVTGSSGFKSFLGSIAAQAPADTQAILGLAGAVGGALSQAWEQAGPHVAATIDQMTGAVNELAGPTATAVTDATIGVGGFAGALAGAVGAAKAGTDFLEGQFQRLSGNVDETAHSAQDFTAANRAIQQPGVISWLEALAGNTDAVKDGFKSSVAAADQNARATGQVSVQAQAAARAQSAFSQDMAIAAGNSGTLASRVTALGTALSNEGDATDAALGGLVSFHQQLEATKTAMAASGDKAGYMTKQSLATAAAFATLYGTAKAASGAILQTGGTAQQAAGPLIAMRDEMEQIQGPTAAERQLLAELNAEIAALHSKTITIGVQVVDEGGGNQPLPVAGGPGGRIQGGPDGQAMAPGAMTPGAMTPSAVAPAPAPSAPVSGAPVQLQIAPGGSGAFERFMATWIRNYVRVHGGGGPQSVQRAFGRAA